MSASGFTRDSLLLEQVVQQFGTPERLAEVAIRTGAHGLRAALGLLASKRALHYGELEAAVASHGSVDLEPRPAAALAEVVAHQSPNDSGRGLAAALLHAVPEPRLDPASLQLLGELLIALGRWEECEALLARNRSRMPFEGRYLELDLVNSLLRGGKRPGTAWSERLAAVFREYCLEPPVPVAGQDGRGHPRLHASPNSIVEDGPLVSVVMVVEQGADVASAARSILNQSWQHLELIAWCTADSVPAALTRLADTDPRVLIPSAADAQGGAATWADALAAASGTFVAVQDGSDWSHPRRLERQMEVLLRDGAPAVTYAGTIHLDARLGTTRPGVPPVAPRGTSAVMRREVADRVLPSVMAPGRPEQETLAQMQGILGQGPLVLADPLLCTRRRAPAGAVQRHQVTAEPPAPQFDVVFISDWSSAGTHHHSLEVVDALDGGCRTAIVHLPDIPGGADGEAPMLPEVRSLLADGRVTQLDLATDIGVRRAVLLEPATLAFPPFGARGVRAREGLIVADSAPVDAGLTRVRYVAREVDVAFRDVFGVAPSWVARDALVRESLRATLLPNRVGDVCLPPLHPPVVHQRRNGIGDLGPVVGCMLTGPIEHLWTAGMPAVYQSPELEIRLRTDRTTTTGTGRGYPPNWVVFDNGDVSPRSFLTQLDFYVDAPTPLGLSSVGRSAAFASGCVVVLAPELGELYGDAALYTSPESAVEAVREWALDPGLMATMRSRARKFAERNLDPRGLRWRPGTEGLVREPMAPVER